MIDDKPTADRSALTVRRSDKRKGRSGTLRPFVINEFQGMRE